MGRLRSLSALTFATVLLGLASLNGILLTLAIPLIIFVLTGMLYGPRSPQLVIERTLSRDRSSIGEEVEVLIRVKNLGRRLEELHLGQFVPKSLELVSGQRSVVTLLENQQVVNIELTVRGNRGKHVFPDIAAIASEHFHLWRKKADFEVETTLLILPRGLPLKKIEIRPRRTRGYSGQIPTRLGGPGIDFFGLRAYEPGDPMQRIDWKTSARHNNALFTKLFQQERVADVSLILDVRHGSQIFDGKDSLFEHSILAVAAMAETFLAAGNRVGLLVYGHLLDWTYPRYGKIQNERILQKLAQAVTGTSPAFSKLDKLPMRLFTAKSQLVFVGPLQNPDIGMLSSIPSRGFALLVISPDPVQYAYRTMKPSDNLDMAVRIATLERALMLRKLRQAGVQVVDWEVTIPFKNIANAHLSRPPQGLRSQGLNL